MIFKLNFEIDFFKAFKNLSKYFKIYSTINLQLIEA